MYLVQLKSQSTITTILINKCCNTVILRGTAANMHMLWFAMDISQLFEKSITTLALIREILRGHGHLTVTTERSCKENFLVSI